MVSVASSPSEPPDQTIMTTGLNGSCNGRVCSSLTGCLEAGLDTGLMVPVLCDASMQRAAVLIDMAVTTQDTDGGMYYVDAAGVLGSASNVAQEATCAAMWLHLHGLGQCFVDVLHAHRCCSEFRSL